MEMHMLLESSMEPIPENIEVAADWGEISIRTDNGFLEGKHIAIRAGQQNVIAWLGKHSGVWIGTGSPMLQEFQVAHIKPELVEHQ